MNLKSRVTTNFFAFVLLFSCLLQYVVNDFIRGFPKAVFFFFLICLF